MHTPLNLTEAALAATYHETSPRMNAHDMRFSLYFSLIQGIADRDELAPDWPHRHILNKLLFLFYDLQLYFFCEFIST